MEINNKRRKIKKNIEMKALTNCPFCDGLTEIRNLKKESKRASKKDPYISCDFCGSPFYATTPMMDGYKDDIERPMAQIIVMYFENTEDDLKLVTEARYRREGFNEHDKNTYIYNYKEW